MKKSMATIIGILGVALLVGCSSGSTTSSQTSAAASDEKVYIFATDTHFPPFEFTDSNQDFVGIDVDILDAIAVDQGFSYQLNSLGFDAALTAVQTGQADAIIAGASITEERKEIFDFTDAYYDSEVTMAVAQNSDVTSFADLSGQTVAVKTGTMGSNFAKSIQEEYGFEIVEFSDSPTMYQDVIAGNTVACFEDYPVMAYNIKNGAQLVIPEDCLGTGSQYGVGVMKGENAELIEMFNAGLANIKANGTFDEIVDKYTK